MSSAYRNLLAGLSENRGSRNVGSYFPQFLSFGNDSNSGETSYISYIGIGLFVLFLVAVVVHFTIKPIFSFGGGESGLVNLGMGVADAQLVWTDGPQQAGVKSTFTNILPCGFTIQMDLFIDRNLQLSNTERVVLYRSEKPVVPDTTGNKTLIQNYPDTNLIVYLQRDTNDLVVSAITEDGNQTYIESPPTILNAPLRQPFRLTVVFLPQLLEVYVNGRFRGSRVLKGQPKNTNSQFFATPDAFQTTIKLMNLAYWNRPLLAREVSTTPPPYPDTTLFRPSDAERCAT